MKRADHERTKFARMNRTHDLYEEHYKSSINTTLDFNNEVLKQLTDLRKEIKCNETEEANEDLSELVFKTVGTAAEALLMGPPPGSKIVKNTF